LKGSRRLELASEHCVQKAVISSPKSVANFDVSPDYVAQGRKIA
jgi:hypothetical protein